MRVAPWARPSNTATVLSSNGIRRIPPEILHEMTRLVDDEDRDEMAMPSYLHKNPAMRWMAWRRVEVVAKHMRKLRARRGRLAKTLDYGCGTGVLLHEACALADTVYGVDLVLEPASLLVERWGLGQVSLLKPDDMSETVEDGSLDAIVAAEVLEHLEDALPSTLTRFSEMLTKEGRLIVSLPTESALYRAGRRLAGFSGHYHHDNAESIHEEILRCGFREEAMEKVPLGGPFSIYWVVVYRNRS